MKNVRLRAAAVSVTLALALSGCNSSSNDNADNGIAFDPADYLLINEPYLMSAQDDTMVVSWRTDAGSESKVIFGTKPGVYQYEVYGQHQRLGYQYHYHTTMIDGLKSGQTYYYRVITDNLASEEFSFVAAPDDRKQGNFRFLVIGDHQYAEDDRIERLVLGAKRVLDEQYPEEGTKAASLVLNVGDQVDESTLHDYRYTHFDKMKYLSGELPFYTVLGNHEYFSDPTASLYFAHFKYDHMHYQGIQALPQYSEEYYAFQKGRVLFVMLNSETSRSHMTGDEMIRQGQWVREVVETADQDDSVDWIFAVSHHPMRSELNSNDEQELVARVFAEELTKSDKFAMHVGAHTHNYARGAFEEHSGYHIISGGASFDEYWTKRSDDPADYETLVGTDRLNDYADVSRTQQAHNFQLIDIDYDTDEVVIQTWTTGNAVNPHEMGQMPELLDEFRLSKSGVAPDAPSLMLSTYELDMQNDTLELALTPYNSAVDAQMFSTEFALVKPNPYTQECDLNTPELVIKRDIENIFGAVDDEDYVGIDRNKDVDITVAYVGQDTDFYQEYALPEGEYCVKARYRDEMQRWSDWSETETLTVINSDVTPINYQSSVNLPLNGHYDNISLLPLAVQVEDESKVRWVEDQERGTVLETGFDGRSNLMITPVDQELYDDPSKWLGQDQITISAWFKPKRLSNWGCYFGIGQRNHDGFCLGSRNNTMWAVGSAMTRAEYGEHEGFNFLRVNSQMGELDKWAHVVTTYDSRLLSVYIDGELVAQEEKGADIIWNADANGNQLNLAGGWSIGDGSQEDERSFEGYISDAQVWARALTQQEIQAIYQQ